VKRIPKRYQGTALQGEALTPPSAISNEQFNS
jgi:hypothetical protein